MKIIKFEWDKNKNAATKRNIKYHSKKPEPYFMMKMQSYFLMKNIRMRKNDIYFSVTVKTWKCW